MKKILALLSILVGGLYGCSTYLYVSLFNNTDEAIQVVSHYSDSVSIEIPAQASRLVKIGVGIQLIVHGKELSYSYPAVPGEYYQSHKVFWYLVNAQLEPNLSILVTKPGSKFPIDPALVQPEGFPLVPEVTQSNNPTQPDGFAAAGLDRYTAAQ